MIPDETIRAMLEAVNVDEPDIFVYQENEKRLAQFVSKIGEPDDMPTEPYVRGIIAHMYYYSDPDTGKPMHTYWAEEERENLSSEQREARIAEMLRTICEGPWVKRHGAKYEAEDTACAS